jgi:hypothetical protein
MQEFFDMEIKLCDDPFDADENNWNSLGMIQEEDDDSKLSIHCEEEDEAPKKQKKRSKSKHANEKSLSAYRGKIKLYYEKLFEICKPTRKTQYEILKKACEVLKHLEKQKIILIEKIHCLQNRNEIREETFPVAYLSKDGRITNCNSDFQNLFNFFNDSNKSIFKLIDEDNLQSWYNAFGNLCGKSNHFQSIRGSFIAGTLKCECLLVLEEDQIKLTLYS